MTPPPVGETVGVMTPTGDYGRSKGDEMSDLIDALDRLRTASIDPIDPTGEAIWTCQIGGALPHAALPECSDQPMREAVQAAYREVTGMDDGYCFTGWGGTLDEGHRAVVEGRAPIYERTTYALLKRAADTIETLNEQIGRLATFIMDEIPGEPSQSEGAVDCAIRLLRGHIGGSHG